tara:strand:- start:678 stop:1214 length:537 start_codon:yes stop_codon:yes gene_type:complete
MSISKKMNTRLERIQKLIDQGYKLENRKFLNIELPIPQLTNSEGREVNIFFNGPAGFSWIAFLFYPVVFFQIRFYSFYLLIAFIWYGYLQILDSGVVPIYLSMTIPVLIFPICWASYFPYLRYTQQIKGIKENNLFLSIVVGTLIYNVAKQIPYYFVFGKLTNFFNSWVEVIQAFTSN